ncbi:MAG: NblA/ycf18 family protein [Cyanobacteriota bacterium]|nr:NblA/ycf18 family protein [Cyanobacteriota bacterium]
MDDFEGLSLEQQFRQRAFETMVERMSPEQAQEFLVKLHKQMLLQEATYRNLLRSSLIG